MTQFVVGYDLVVYAPRSEQADPANETTVLTPRAGALHADPFRVWTLPTESVSLGYKGYLRPPRGRKSGLDPLERTSDVGSMAAEILDKRLGTSNSQRWLSQYFSSVTGEARLQNCLAVMRETRDGGCTWSPYFAGRIKEVRRTSRHTWELVIRDLVEDWKRDIFVGQPGPAVRIQTTPTATRYAQLTTLQPHHNLAPYHNIFGRGEIPGVIQAATSAAPRSIATTGGAPYDRWRIVSKGLMERASAIGTIDPLRNQFTRLDFSAGAVKIRLTNPATAATGVFDLRTILCYNDTYHAIGFKYFFDEVPAGHEGYATLAAIGAAGTAITFALYSGGALGGQTALLLTDVHPVQLLADLCDGQFGPLAPDGTPLYTIRRDASASVWATMLADPTWGTVSYIIDAQSTFAEWAPENLCRPHGLGLVADASGYLVPVDMRAQVYASLPEITDADLAVGEGGDEEQSQSAETAINTVTVTYWADLYQSDFVPSRDQSDYPEVPPGLILPVKQVIRDAGDPDDPLAIANLVDMGVRKRDVPANGLRYSPDYISIGSVANARLAEKQARLLAATLRAEYARGARHITLRCRRTAVPSGTQVGDMRFLTCSTLLNPDTLEYDGTQLARCIERAEQEEVLVLTFQVSGLSSQAIAPTVSTPTQTGTDIFGAILQLTITLNAAGDPAELRFAVTDTGVATIPADDDPAWAPSQVVTASGTYLFTGFPLGKRIWVQVRSNPALATGGTFRQPSAWVAPAGTPYVDTSSLPAPSGVVVTEITGSTARVSWTGGDDGWQVQILHRGGTSLINWLDSEVVATLVQPPRTWVLGDMFIAHDYVVGVRFLDPLGNPGPVTAVAFTAGGTYAVAPRPAGIDFVYWSHIQLQVYSADSTYDIEVERQNDLAGAPDPSTSVTFPIPRSGSYFDYQAPDFTTFWYRARHRLDAAGVQPGPWLPWASTQARPDTPYGGGGGGTSLPPYSPDLSIDPGLGSTPPAPVMPTVAVAQSAALGVGTCTLTVTDPQQRVTAVEFQTYDGTTTSAWAADATAPYSTTVPFTPAATSIIRYRVIGYDAAGQAGQVLVAGEVYFGGTAGTTTFEVPLPVVIDGGGVAILAGDKGDVICEFDGIITGWGLLGDQSGSIVVDCYKCTYAQFDNTAHPVAADSIWGGTPPSITAAHKNRVTGLSIPVTQGDILRFHVPSASGFTRVTCSLTFSRTV